MPILGLNGTVVQFAVVNHVHWYGHVLLSEGDHVLRRVLTFEVEGQGKKGRPKETLGRQAEEVNINVGESREDALWQSNRIVCDSVTSNRLC